MPTVTSPETTSDDIAKDIDDQTLIGWLRGMLLIREFEVRTMQQYQNKKVGGFCHIYIGQEAVAVGCLAAIRKTDPVITAYRDHGHALACGMDPRHCMAEMFGRIGGCAKGKGGSMHMFDRANNLFGGHGIVGAHTPLAVGLAFATKYQDEVIDKGKSDRITLCFFGDGALNQGSFHEAMNLAGLFDLPVVFVCENNGYAMGTSIERGTTMAHDVCAKAAGYGIDSAVIDGLDVVNVYNGMKDIVDRTREKSRPFFIDMRTYRYKGHSMSDPRKYRTKDEEQSYEENDPLDRLSDYLIGTREFTKDSYDTMQKEVRTQVREAIKWAEESPAPVVEEELYKDVFTDVWGPYTGTTLPEMLKDNED